MAYYVGAPLSAGLFDGMLTDPNDPSGFLGESPSSTVNASVFNDPFGMSHHQALQQFTASLAAPTLQNASSAIPASVLNSLGPLTNLGELQRQQQAELAQSPTVADTPATANELSKSRWKDLKKGTKRPRPTLSCTECVRRKSKCDRTVPCATCIKRGTPERCRVDDEEARPMQPFAQARELDAVQDRVQRLEQLLLHIAPEQAKRFLDENTAIESAPAAPRTAATTRANSIDDDDEAGEEGGEAEKAAFALESIAVAGRGNTAAGADLPESLESLPLTAQARIRENHLRRQEIDFLMSMLPDWATARSLVTAFFEKCTWQHHVVHVPTYEAQLSALKELIQQGRIAEIDPAWLSLHFMVLACGLFFSPNRREISAINQTEYTNTWVLCAQRALTVADWSGRPQLTCIQSVVLFPIILMHTGGIKRLASWIAAALRMAQLLDLHRLDDRVPVSKLGAAANLTSVEKEIGKRVYFALTHGEVNFASRWLGLDQSASASQAQIPNLLNVDDNDLLVSSPVSKPIEVATASSFQVLRARIMLADISARLTGSDAKVHKYETVLAFDQRTRHLLESLPPYFRYDRADDPEIKSVISERPYIAYQRCVILYGLNNRLLRAHRPFMTRGYTDSKYAYSTSSCIRAAKVIIAAQRALREIFDAADRMYNCLLYCFSSAVVLLVDNFHRLSAVGELGDTEELDAQRREAFDVLLMLRRESNTSTIAAASAKVLEGLLNEEDSRRQQRGMAAASTSLSRGHTPDSAGPSLREAVDRIAGVVQGSAGSANKSTLAASTTQTRSTNQGTSQAPPSRPSLTVPVSASDIGITIAPGTQSFVGLGSTNTLSQEESEELLRSLGFFEVTANGIPSFASQESVDTIFANGSSTQVDGWLDGFGEW